MLHRKTIDDASNHEDDEDATDEQLEPENDAHDIEVVEKWQKN